MPSSPCPKGLCGICVEGRNGMDGRHRDLQQSRDDNEGEGLAVRGRSLREWWNTRRVFTLALVIGVSGIAVGVSASSALSASGPCAVADATNVTSHDL